MSEAIYVLRDTRANLGTTAMFWKKGGSYTSNISKADHFTFDEAIRQNKSRDSDQPLPLNMVMALANTTVDHQHLDDTKTPAPGDMCVIQVGGKWDGNDIYFYNAESASNGEPKETTTLDHATVYEHSEASRIAASIRKGKVWPLSFMQSIGRPVVQSKNIETAIKRAQTKALELLATKI